MITGTFASRVDALGLGNFPDRGFHQSYKNLRVARSEAASFIGGKDKSPLSARYCRQRESCHALCSRPGARDSSHHSRNGGVKGLIREPERLEFIKQPNCLFGIRHRITRG